MRKGQHLFNEIVKECQLDSAEHNMMIKNSMGNLIGSKTFEYPYYNLHSILFNMTDVEFDRIMSKLQKVKNE